MEPEARVIDLSSCTVTFLGADVAHTHFKDGRIVQPAEVEAMFAAIAEGRNGRKVLLMVSVGEHTTMSNEARAFASGPVSDRYIAADAIIVRDFGHQLAANVFVRHHKPMRPIQMFGDRDTALAWLHTQQHLLDA
ncbi:MAG: hypothetical protein MUE88_03225 [Flavobacteriales bacterium]|nr:hypothetical protein [Flavobacteriales bacterium]